MQGVEYVRLAISKTDYLIAHINEYDRVPSWDGDIEVYRKAGDVHLKDDLIIKVPIQVKGHKENDLGKEYIMYPVGYIDMKNYLALGGTVFFVVYVDTDGDNHRIYYAELLPYTLKRLLREHENKATKTKNIRMESFPTKKEDISNVLLEFARNMKKQRAAIYADEVSLADLVKDGRVPELSFGFSRVFKKKFSPLSLMHQGNFYIYAKLPHGIELPVEYVKDVEMAGMTVSADVTVNGKCFYAEYTIVYKKDIVEVCFGKSTKHIIKIGENNKQEFCFTLSGKLSERIRDEEFIIEALSAQQFEVGGVVCPLNEATPDEIKAFDLPRRKEHLEWLFTVEKILTLLDVDVELNVDELTDKDENKLHLLKTAFIDGKTVSLKDPGNAVGFFNIANLKILVCVLKQKDGKFRIYHYSDAPIDVIATGISGEKQPSSFFVLLKKEEILGCSNLNFEKIVDRLKEVQKSELYFEQITLFVLELLKAYDENGGKRVDILEAAISLSEWQREEDEYTPKNICALNYYQAIKRQREFHENELEELLLIVESQPEEEIYAGAYLLLDKQDAARIHFLRMDIETQEIFRAYPIFRFWKEE